ncbi:hypothetical protein [Nostoc sp.]
MRYNNNAATVPHKPAICCIWYDDANPDPAREQTVKKIVRSGEPVFLYRCGGKVQPPPKGYYWRMMQEHPSMRIYQLEIKDGE